MGEYAKFNRRDIKIGTCEDMYYLRADQSALVQPLPGNVDPVRDRAELRFRFPWPDEDEIRPGAFERYERGVGLHGVEQPATVDHGVVQFTAPGYNVCLPCPESKAYSGLKIHRNGHPGPVQIVQQRWIGDQLVLICACGGCGAKWREATLDEARPYIDACLREAANRELPPATASDGEWWREVARRIKVGYQGLVR